MQTSRPVEKFSENNMAPNIELSISTVALGIAPAEQGREQIVSGSHELGSIEGEMVTLHSSVFRDYLQNGYRYLHLKDLNRETVTDNPIQKRMTKTILDLIELTLVANPNSFSAEMFAVLSTKVRTDRVAEAHFKFIFKRNLEKARLLAVPLAFTFSDELEGIEDLAARVVAADGLLRAPDLLHAFTVEGIVGRQLTQNALPDHPLGPDENNRRIVDFDERQQINALARDLSALKQAVYYTLYVLWGFRPAYTENCAKVPALLRAVQNKAERLKAFYRVKRADAEASKIKAVDTIENIANGLGSFVAQEPRGYAELSSQLKEAAANNNTFSEASAISILRYLAIQRSGNKGKNKTQILKQYCQLAQTLSQHSVLRKIAIISQHDLQDNTCLSQAADPLLKQLFDPDYGTIGPVVPGPVPEIPVPLLTGISLGELETEKELEAEWQFRWAAGTLGAGSILGGAALREAVKYVASLAFAAPIPIVMGAMAVFQFGSDNYLEVQCVDGMNKVIRAMNDKNISEAKRLVNEVKCEDASEDMQMKFEEVKVTLACLEVYLDAREHYNAGDFRAAYDELNSINTCDASLQGGYAKLMRYSLCSDFLKRLHGHLTYNQSSPLSQYSQARALFEKEIHLCDGIEHPLGDLRKVVPAMIDCVEGLYNARGHYSQGKFAETREQLVVIAEPCQMVTSELQKDHAELLENANCGVSLQTVTEQLHRNDFKAASSELANNSCSNAETSMQQQHSQLQCLTGVLEERQALNDRYMALNAATLSLDIIYTLSRSMFTQSKEVEKRLLNSYYLLSLGGFVWRMAELSKIHASQQLEWACTKVASGPITDAQYLQGLSVTSLLFDWWAAARQDSTNSSTFDWRDYPIAAARAISHTLLFTATMFHMANDEKTSLAETLCSMQLYFISLYCARILFIGYDFFERKQRAAKTGTPNESSRYAPLVKAFIDGHLNPEYKSLLFVPLFYQAYKIDLAQTLAAGVGNAWNYLSAGATAVTQFLGVKAVMDTGSMMLLQETSSSVSSTLADYNESVAEALGSSAEGLSLLLQHLSPVAALAFVGVIYYGCYQKFCDYSKPQQGPAGPQARA